jgi:hypothetical protein
MNRAAELELALQSALEQSIAVDEILVIDGGTAAAQDELPPAFADPRIRRIRMEPGLSAQRNRGLQEAHSDILTFMDDDAVLSPEYVQHVMGVFMEEPDTVAVGGINIAARFPGRVERLFRSLLGVQTGCGPNRMRRSGFPDVGFVPKRKSLVGVLPSTVLSLRSSACQGLQFEEYWLSGVPLGMQTGRCFGEDVHFTAQLAERGRLCIVPAAVFRHDPSPRNRESTYVTQALYVFAMRWISKQHAKGTAGRFLRPVALLGQLAINLAQCVRYADTGYIRGWLRAMSSGMG